MVECRAGLDTHNRPEWISLSWFVCRSLDAQVRTLQEARLRKSVSSLAHSLLFSFQPGGLKIHTVGVPIDVMSCTVVAHRLLLALFAVRQG